MRPQGGQQAQAIGNGNSADKPGRTLSSVASVASQGSRIMLGLAVD